MQYTYIQYSYALLLQWKGIGSSDGKPLLFEHVRITEWLLCIAEGYCCLAESLYFE